MCIYVCVVGSIHVPLPLCRNEMKTRRSQFSHSLSHAGSRDSSHHQAALVADAFTY